MSPINTSYVVHEDVEFDSFVSVGVVEFVLSYELT